MNHHARWHAALLLLVISALTPPAWDAAAKDMNLSNASWQESWRKEGTRADRYRYGEGNWPRQWMEVRDKIIKGEHRRAARFYCSLDGLHEQRDNNMFVLIDPKELTSQPKLAQCDDNPDDNLKVGGAVSKIVKEMFGDVAKWRIVWKPVPEELRDFKFGGDIGKGTEHMCERMADETLLRQVLKAAQERWRAEACEYRSDKWSPSEEKLGQRYRESTSKKPEALLTATQYTDLRDWQKENPRTDKERNAHRRWGEQHRRRMIHLLTAEVEALLLHDEALKLFAKQRLELPEGYPRSMKGVPRPSGHKRGIEALLIAAAADVKIRKHLKEYGIPVDNLNRLDVPRLFRKKLYAACFYLKTNETPPPDTWDKMRVALGRKGMAQFTFVVETSLVVKGGEKDDPNGHCTKSDPAGFITKQTKIVQIHGNLDHAKGADRDVDFWRIRWDTDVRRNFDVRLVSGRRQGLAGELDLPPEGVIHKIEVTDSNPKQLFLRVSTDKSGERLDYVIEIENKEATGNDRITICEKAVSLAGGFPY